MASSSSQAGSSTNVDVPIMLGERIYAAYFENSSNGNGNGNNAMNYATNAKSIYPYEKYLEKLARCCCEVKLVKKSNSTSSSL